MFTTLATFDLNGSLGQPTNEMMTADSYVFKQNLPLPQSSIIKHGLMSPSINRLEYEIWSKDNLFEAAKYADDGGCVIPPTDEILYSKPIQPWNTCIISSNYSYESSNYLNYFCQTTAGREEDDEAINDSLIYEHREQKQIQKLQSLQQTNNHIPANNAQKKQQIAESTQTAQVLVGTSKPPPRRANEQKRQAIACFNCRQRRLKCDGENPCSPCVRRGVADTCAFAQQVRRRGPGRKKLAQLASLGDVDAAKALGIEPGDWIRDPELYPPSPKRKRNA